LALGLLCAVVAALPASFAHAEPALDLRWDAPAECPDAKNVKRRIRELGQTSAQALRLRAEGRIERVETRYRLVLKIHDGAEVRERTIESASCEDLAGAAAVSLGLLLRAVNAQAAAGEGGTDVAAGSAEGERGQGKTEPGSNASAQSGADGSGSNPAASSSSASGADTAGAPRGETKPASPKDVEVTPAVTQPVQEETADVPKRHWAVLLRLPQASLSSGPLPKPSLGVEGGLGWSYDQWRMLLLGRIYRSQTVWSELSPDTGAEIDRRAVSFSACRQLRAGAFAWAPCAALELEQVSAQGIGVGIAQQTSRAWVPVFGVSPAGYVYFAPWLALQGSLSLSVASARPRVVIDGFGPVQQLGALRAGAALGLEWIF
jgi:hypothetical protein